jgi:hypothetical protein
MTVRFAKYDQSGRILFIGEVPESMLDAQTADGNALVVGVADPATDYVRRGRITARPVNPAQLDGLQLTGLPAPCAIHINGQRYDCPDREATLHFSYPGSYQIRVEAFPYLDAIFTVEST